MNKRRLYFYYLIYFFTLKKKIIFQTLQIFVFFGGYFRRVVCEWCNINNIYCYYY